MENNKNTERGAILKIKKGNKLQLGDIIELENGWKAINGIKYLQKRGPIKLTLEGGYWLLIGAGDVFEVQS